MSGEQTKQENGRERVSLRWRGLSPGSEGYSSNVYQTVFLGNHTNTCHEAFDCIPVDGRIYNNSMQPNKDVELVVGAVCMVTDPQCLKIIHSNVIVSDQHINDLLATTLSLGRMCINKFALENLMKVIIDSDTTLHMFPYLNMP